MNNQCIFAGCNPGFLDCNNNQADGCEVNINDDAMNCGSCGNVCPPAMPGCNNGVCAMGCLNGKMPPRACQAGQDPVNMSNWVVCTADCMTAWISANTSGNFHAAKICMNLGYSKLGSYGGTCGNVCGYCQGNTSCMAPGMMHFDNAGNCGMDANGPILCSTVMWQCLK